MTCVLTGFSRHRNRIGTIYSDGTLTAADTDINVNGVVTVTPPVTPSTDQTINITNTGTSTVTVAGVTTIAPGGSIVIYWGGASWGWVNSDCTGGAIPASSDRGVSVYSGPSLTPYTVPQTTETISDVFSLPCGTAVIKKVTKSYAERIFADGYSTTLGFLAPGVGGFPIVGGSISGFGDTRNAMLASVATNGVGLLASEYGAGIYYPPNGVWPDGYEFRLINKRAGSGIVAAYYDYYTNYGITFSGVYGYSAGASGSDGRPDLYYIDVHEVWTYEAI